MQLNGVSETLSQKLLSCTPLNSFIIHICLNVKDKASECQIAHDPNHTIHFVKIIISLGFF